ncbi:glutamate--tRNA ligase [Hydrogenimonas thermophila]|uniref:glutamate--tRNA ligase n=1 Tax=Hydrogenimonas thermophila TaxID=223786 RepID=UPI00293745DD|nr:glutamate--tRNA ligase [Hydrogenimonas thermophila]WOE69257.1 glutamate--tRNA ligase [Hydrogenimonas thermophila]WOE71767.1 glutamate--tRNA ligase [Hydrogenimonas thermophila]
MLRFAPSPTGDMHIGNLRVAIFNYIVAKQKKERFIVRIEDTDKERNIEGKDREILEILQLFNLHPDDVYYQSHNLTIHQHMAIKLLEERKAFACFCTPEELEREREAAKNSKKAYRYSGKCIELSDAEVLANEKPFTVRLKKPENNVEFNDLIKGEQSFAPDDIDSFVIMRADKTPTYNFACALDDMIHDISLVIRGEDHVSNTPKQIHIRNQLGYDKEITYAHLPIILNTEGKKMSKRDDASSVKWLLEEGFLPEAIANYLILLGNKTPCEVFCLQEAIEWFDLAKLSKAAAKFDIDKLRFLNREHMKRMDSKELSRAFGFADASIGELVKCYLEEGSTIKEIKPKIEAIFAAKPYDNEWKEQMEKLRDALNKTSSFETFDELKSYLMKETGLKGKNFFKPLRLLLTGAEHGPELSNLYPHLKSYLMEIVK